jgi:hypothetical protein
MDAVQSEIRSWSMPAPSGWLTHPLPLTIFLRPAKPRFIARRLALRPFQSRRSETGRTGRRKVLLMPKNIFQRPQQVAHTRNVPRHGAPIPMRKIEARKVAQPRQEATMPLPALEALLKSPRN